MIVWLCSKLNVLLLFNFFVLFFFFVVFFCREVVADGGECSTSYGSRPKRLLRLSQKSLEAFEMPTDSDT